jgi:hypothetical protein
MKTLRLIRVTEHAGATFGVLCINEAPEFLTVEDAWRSNETKVSCIPVGRYKIIRHKSPRFGNVYKVLDVPEREHILIHAGNTHRDTEGCILLGMQYGKIGSDSAILASRSAFLQFMKLMENTPEAQLLIIDAYGGGRVH